MLKKQHQRRKIVCEGVKGRGRVQSIGQRRGTISMNETPRSDRFVWNAAAPVNSRRHHSGFPRLRWAFAGPFD